MLAFAFTWILIEVEHSLGFLLPLPFLECQTPSLSAIIMSPGSSNSSRPDFSVNYLSDILPPHASDTKLTSPVGVHPTRIF